MITLHNGDGTSIKQLVAYFKVKQQDILLNWRSTCGDDVLLKGFTELNCQQFYNQVPEMLNLLNQHLQGQFEKSFLSVLIVEHGLHRWQKGYTLAELTLETQHLGRLLLAELRNFWRLYPGADTEVISVGYEQISEFGNEMISGSITQYADLQCKAAIDRTNALQKTLDEINLISSQRINLLRRSTHDLRGSFGALQGAAELLEMTTESDCDRKKLNDILNRNLMNCRKLIVQLMDLARLESGQETLNIETVDVGELLNNLATSYQHLASERGLFLTCDGPQSLLVECDPVHLQRIIQNLVLNALKHTPSGWVAISWSIDDDRSWTVSVQDTGPGLPSSKSNEYFKEDLIAPIYSDVVDNLASQTNQFQKDFKPAFDTTFSHKGEGIGLSIVKGLCELLKANLEINSSPDKGTLFRIRLAR